MRNRSLSHGMTEIVAFIMGEKADSHRSQRVQAVLDFFKAAGQIRHRIRKVDVQAEASWIIGHDLSSIFIACSGQLAVAFRVEEQAA